MRLWNDYEGTVIAGAYPIQKLLRPEGRSAFFSTSNGTGKPAVIRLIESLNDEAEILERWRAVSQLEQAHLVTFRKYGQTVLDGTPLIYAVMEPTEADLASILRERPLTLDETRQVASSLVEALQSLHHSNLVHEHIEPINVLAVDDTVKLRSDCVREIPSDLSRSERQELIARDVHDLAQTLCLCLTQQRIPPPIGAIPLPAPFDQIVRNGLLGAWTLDNIAELLPPAPKPQPAPPSVAPTQTTSPSASQTTGQTTTPPSDPASPQALNSSSPVRPDAAPGSTPTLPFAPPASPAVPSGRPNNRLHLAPHNFAPTSPTSGNLAPNASSVTPQQPRLSIASLYAPSSAPPSTRGPRRPPAASTPVPESFSPAAVAASIPAAPRQSGSPHPGRINLPLQPAPIRKRLWLAVFAAALLSILLLGWHYLSAPSPESPQPISAVPAQNPAPNAGPTNQQPATAQHNAARVYVPTPGTNAASTAAATPGSNPSAGSRPNPNPAVSSGSPLAAGTRANDTSSALAAKPSAAGGTFATRGAASTGGATANWRVVAFTYLHEDQARHKAATIAQKHKYLSPQVFEPGGHGPWLVTLGGFMTRDQAETLRNRARADGLPRDTFIRNYTR